jgi:hypothetical protein
MAADPPAPDQQIADADAPAPVSPDDTTPAAPTKPATDYNVRLGPLEITPRFSMWLILIVSLGINALLMLIVVIVALLRAGKL